MYYSPMLEGRCPKCGMRYFGWALQNPRNQACSKCGSGLEIFKDGQKVGTGYSPFAAERYRVDVPTDPEHSPAEQKAGKDEVSRGSRRSEHSAHHEQNKEPRR